MLTDVLKQRFQKGEVLYGTFIDSGCEDMVEIVALGGFDYAIIDSEHSPCDPATAIRLVRAAEARGLPILVRVNNSQPGTILKMMDIGASGIMAPLIHDAGQAKAVADAVKYYPAGRRGTALMRASDYGFTGIDAYFAKTNSQAFVMVQAESVEAVENLEKIVAVKEIDAVFIGPYDLSQSMGIPGQVESGPILDIVKRAGRIIRDAGKVPGILPVSYEKARMFKDWGYQLLTFITDLDIFGRAVKDTVANLKKL
jgi:4-hydroxy-2-oxoheptanedioate aldolase